MRSDEGSQTLRMRRGDRKEDSFESWYGRDENTGNHLPMVKTTTRWENTVTTGTMHGKNGSVYQILRLENGDVVAEEIKQEMVDVEGDDDVDPDTIDEIDGLPVGGRRGRWNLFSAPKVPCALRLDPPPDAHVTPLLALAVAEINKAYELSGIPTKFRLVKTHFDATYNDYANFWDPTLANLRVNYLTTFMPCESNTVPISSTRLWTWAHICGMGYTTAIPTARDAFSLTQCSCTTRYYSFGHEIGHNIACNDDIKNALSTGGVS
ncbi:hypothetical protein MHU86_249 [Fragilaria crotonensis]|nr:hypothetical protein MHU86_249 [Fragilaria crotonensis]